MAGWIKLSRDIVHHPLWSNLQYSHWYLELLILANHADEQLIEKNTVFTLRAGELRMSVADLCKRWGKSNKTVLAFLKVLSDFGLIKRRLVHSKLPIITMCETDFYEDSLHSNVHSKLHSNVHNNNKNIENISHSHAYVREEVEIKAPAAPVYSEEELRQAQLNDTMWHEAVAKYFGEDLQNIPALIRKFHQWCDASDSRRHSDMRDMRSHFAAWYNRTSSQPQTKNNNGTTKANNDRRGTEPPVSSEADYFADFPSEY